MLIIHQGLNHQGLGTTEDLADGTRVLNSISMARVWCLIYSHTEYIIRGAKTFKDFCDTTLILYFRRTVIRQKGGCLCFSC